LADEVKKWPSEQNCYICARLPVAGNEGHETREARVSTVRLPGPLAPPAHRVGILRRHTVPPCIHMSANDDKFAPSYGVCIIRRNVKEAADTISIPTEVQGLRIQKKCDLTVIVGF
jgi:hypothetical protein